MIPHLFRWFRLRRGVLMLDVLIGIAVFSVFVSFIVFSMLFSQQSLLLGGDRMRAVYLAQQGVEAARAVRDRDFAELTEGTFGAVLSPTGEWILSGTGTITDDGFVTTVTLVSTSEDSLDVTAQTQWNTGLNRSGSVILHTQLANWRAEHSIGNWAAISVEGSYEDSGTPLFNSAAVSGNIAFISSEIADGGAGLYVFDITDRANPIRIAAGFILGSPGYELTVWNDHLILVAGDDGAEVQIYDISDPTNLSSDDLVTSIDIPGDSRARALAVFGDILFITTTEDIIEDEFYAYDIAELSDISLMDSLSDDGSYRDIHLYEGYAYVASFNDTMELRVIDVFNAEDLSFAPGEGYNLTDIPDGRAVVTYESSLLIGRDIGDVTEELVLFDISGSPVPSPPPGPWYAGAGGAVNALDVDPSGVYGFAAGDSDAAELRVLDLAAFRSGANPLITFYDTDTGPGRSVYYIPPLDRLIFLTNTAFFILEPS